MTNTTTSQWVLDALALYERALVRYASAIVGPASATDVVQETFLRLCNQKREAVEPHLRAWLFTVCRNRALDMRRQKRFIEPTAEVFDVIPHPSDGPAETLLRKEAITRLLGALDTLPERQREVVLLKFSGDLSYQEIAEVVGTSASNVGFILHTALKTLRAEIANEAKNAERGA